MGSRLTFLHAADLHLGAPLRSLRCSSPSLAEELSRSSSNAFDRLVELAIGRSVDFVVLAGDVFDKNAPSFAEYMRFHDALLRLEGAGIPVYIVSGNHDTSETWDNRFASLPGNVTTFLSSKAEYALFQREGVPLATIVGKGLTRSSKHSSQDVLLGMDRASAECACRARTPFCIGILHSGLDLDPSVAPASKARLGQCGLDYWALGHIHKAFVDSFHNPRIAFSGCMQGRDINEPGEHGCYVVTLEEEMPNKCEFVALASVIWQKLQVDVSNCVTLQDVASSARIALSDAFGSWNCERLIARIELMGRTSLHSLLTDDEVVDELISLLNNASDSCFCDDVIAMTQPEIDWEALVEEDLFPAQVLREADALASNENAAVVFLHRKFAEKRLSYPGYDPSEVASLCAEAEFMLIDLLQGDPHE